MMEYVTEPLRVSQHCHRLRIEFKIEANKGFALAPNDGSNTHCIKNLKILIVFELAIPLGAGPFDEQS